MNDSSLKTDELRSALSIIGDKWTALILHSIKDGSRRFVDCQKGCGGLSSRTLAQRLSMLESEGIISRTEYKEYPPRTEYKLTPKGKDLMPVLDQMANWAKKHLDYTPQKIKTKTAPS